MHPTARRFFDRSLTIRPSARRRGGFTLVEMMVSVTLVMLMMLMFAEIFGLAQETISKQKGIATNDQKARILAEVLRTDLRTRTFRDVYPFKCELQLATPPDVTQVLSTSPWASKLEDRRGYFSYSENDPGDSTDDVLQFTIDLLDVEHGIPGVDIYGKAKLIPTLANGPEDGPEFDDGIPGNGAGASKWAEVSYFLRDGNLYRSVLLIRNPYFEPSTTSTLGKTTPENFPGSSGATPPVYPGSFWNDFDYSTYREVDDPATIPPANEAGLEFHGELSLSNNPDPAAADGNDTKLYQSPTNPTVRLYLPRSLGAPQFRFGHSVTLHGQPFGFSGIYNSSMTSVDALGDGNGLAEPAEWTAWKTAHPFFFGRFNSQERSDVDMTFPGGNFGPFASTPAPTFVDSDNNGTIDTYQGGSRRGVDLMLPNVHAFDVQVWDDVVGGFVNLGHDRSGDNPYTDTNNDGNFSNDLAESGFYHISRLRTAAGTAAVAFGSNYGSVPDDFGNRYDTWSPNMYIYDAATAPFYFRTGRAPYRPLKTNPNPNTATSVAHEQTVMFGDTTLDDDGDSIPYPTDPLATDSTDAEAPLRAIRVTVRYLDPHSGQTRQATIEQSLVGN